jgi:hypothetical protein
MRGVLRVLTVCFLAVVFLAVTFTMVFAEQLKPGVSSNIGQVVTKPVPVFTCPSGWHQTKNTSEERKCGPNKPSPIACPEGWTYVEALDCKSYPGLGSQVSCQGCEVGCLKKPVIK